MGEYFVAINPDRNEYVSPTDLGAGLKRGENLRSGAGALDAVAMLLADPGSGRRRPADQHVRGLTGRWAGERCIFVGDGAWHDSIKPWPWRVPEADMYSAAFSEGTGVGAAAAKHVARIHGQVMAVRRMRVRNADNTVDEYKSSVMVPLIQENGQLRVPVPEMEGWADEYADAERRLRRLSPDKFTIDARDGTRRLLANLDRREYIDPRHMAEHPTLVGILRGQSKWWDPERPHECHDQTHPPSTLMLLGRMIFPEHIEGREVDGRWRGDRLLLTAEASRLHPTTAAVEGGREWTDITPRLLASVEDVDWAHYHRRMHRQIYGEIAP